jgi:hypothetical protein
MADMPTKKAAQPSTPAVKVHKQLAEGKKPVTGGSYAKGPQTRP